MDPGLAALYGDKVRVRACGLCWQGADILMVNHQGLTQGGFWAPPGGGLAFGETVRQCLEREFVEETGLKIKQGRFLFACEFLRKPLHAIEIFFEVTIAGGTLRTGDDPELSIIKDVRFLSPDALKKLAPSSLHGIFRLVSSPEELKTLTGFFTI